MLRYSWIRKIRARAVIAAPRRAAAPRLSADAQLLFEPSRDGVPAAGKRPDHDAVRRVQVGDDRPGHMPQPPGHPVSLHRVADRSSRPPVRPSGHVATESLQRRACTTMSGCTARTPWLTVAPNSVDRVIRYCAGSTALDPASNHAVSARRPLRRRLDTMARPARVRIRSRKPMHPRTAPVVRLKGPLALGHGCLSSLRLAVASDAQV